MRKAIILVIIILAAQYCFAQDSIVVNEKTLFILFHSNDTLNNLSTSTLSEICNQENIVFDSLTQKGITLLPLKINDFSKPLDSIYFQNITDTLKFNILIKKGRKVFLRITSIFVSKNDSIIYEYYLSSNLAKDRLTNLKVNSFSVKTAFRNGKITVIIRSIMEFKLFYYISDNIIDSIFSKKQGNKIGVEYQNTNGLEELFCHCNNKSIRINYEQISSQEKLFKNCCGIYPHYWYLAYLQCYGVWIKRSSILYPFIPYVIDKNSIPLPLNFQLQNTNIILINEK